MNLRSLLFVPGDRPDRMEKALGAGADALILDLEDAVAPANKQVARHEVAHFLNQHNEMRILVRVNPLDSPENEKDLNAVLPSHPDGIVLPKAEGGASVAELAKRLTERGNATAQILPIATETPAAIFQLGSYGGAKRLLGLTWGAEDLPAAVGAATSVTGSVGFIGLIAPHLVRPFVGYQPSRTLLPSALFGAALLLMADIGTRVLHTSSELRLGVITSLIGTRFFCWLVVRLRRLAP